MVYDPSYPYHMYGTFKSNGTAQPGDFENAFPSHTSRAAGNGKFVILLFLSGVQMLMTVAAYYISAGIASVMQDYNFLLSPFFVIKNVLTIYLAAIPMAAVFWMISVWISSPIGSIALGLASLVPSVLIINTKIWFAYPMSYPFYLLMIQYGRAAEGIYETQIQWIPWIPVAAAVTVLALGLSCVGFGWKNK